MILEMADNPLRTIKMTVQIFGVTFNIFQSFLGFLIKIRRIFNPKFAYLNSINEIDEPPDLKLSRAHNCFLTG